MINMSEAAEMITESVNKQAAEELVKRLWRENRELQREVAALRAELDRRDAAAGTVQPSLSRVRSREQMRAWAYST